MDIFSLGMKADTRDLNRGKRDVENFAKAGESAERKVTKSTTKMGQSFNQMTGFVRAAGAALAAFGAVQAVREITRISDEYANVNARLKLVTESTEELASVQSRLFGIAQSTSTEFSAVAELYTKVARAADDLGASQEEMLQFTQSINQAFQVSGASTAEAAGATRQLAQALQSGVLRGDEFNSINEQGGRIMQALADGLGIARGELRGMAEDGELTADVVLPALLSQAGKINAEFMEMPRTVGRAATELGNAFDQAIASSDVTPITESIDDLRELIEDPSFRQSIANLAGALIGAFSTALQWVVKLSDGIRDAWGDIMRRIHGPLLDDADAIKKSIAEIDAQIEMHESKIGSVSQTGLAWITEEIAKLEERKGQYQTMLSLNKDLEESSKRVADAQKDVNVSINVNTQETVKARQEMAKKRKEEEKAAEAAAKLEEKIKAQLPVLREQLRLMEEGIDADMARYLAEFAAASSDAERELLALNRAISETTKEADPFADAWESAMERIDSAFADAWKGAFESFENFKDAMSDGLKQLVAEIAHANITKPIIDQLKGAVSGGGGITGAIDGIKSLFTGGGFTSSLASGGLYAAIAIGAERAFTGAQTALDSDASDKDRILGAIDVALPGIGTAIGKAVDAVFGSSKWRTASSGLELAAMGADLMGQTFEFQKRDRGALHSTDTRTRRRALDEEVNAALQDAYDATIQGVVDTFGTLGTEVTEEMVASFSTEMQRLVLTKSSEEEINAAVEKFMGGIASDFADWISRLTGQEEIGIERLGELASALKSVNIALDATGIALMQLSMQGAEASERLIAAAGGIEQFAANVTAYEAFAVTDAERIARAGNQLHDMFTELGFQMPNTREEVRRLVEGLDLTTDSGAEAFTAITAASSLMEQYYSAQESSAKKLAEVANISAEEVTEFTKAIADAMGVAGFDGENVGRRDATFWALQQLGGTVGGGVVGSMGLSEAIAQGAPLQELLKWFSVLLDPERVSEIADSVADITAAYEEQAQAIEASITELDSLSSAIAEFAKDTVAAVDTPMQSLARLRREFSETIDAAMGGDRAAMGAIPTAGGSLVDAIVSNAATAFDAAVQIAVVRGQAQGVLGSIAEQKTEAQLQLEIMQQQLGGIVDVKDATLSVAEQIEMLRKSFETDLFGLASEAGLMRNAQATPESPSAALMAARERAGLPVDPMKEVREELNQQREEMRIGMAAIAENTKQTAKKLERFDDDDALAVRVLT